MLVMEIGGGCMEIGVCGWGMDGPAALGAALGLKAGPSVGLLGGARSEVPFAKCCG